MPCPSKPTKIFYFISSLASKEHLNQNINKRVFFILKRSFYYFKKEFFIFYLTTSRRLGQKLGKHFHWFYHVYFSDKIYLILYPPAGNPIVWRHKRTSFLKNVNFFKSYGSLINFVHKRHQKNFWCNCHDKSKIYDVPNFSIVY